MKKIFVILFVAMVAITSVISAERDNTMKIYNWADYISPEVLESFPQWYEQQTGETVEIIYNTFDVNENMLTQIEMGKEDYDVICPSEYIIDRMIKLNLLMPIEKSMIPDSINYFRNIAPFAINNFRQLSDSVDVTDYAVGYMWGTTGWLYNEEHVSRDEVNSWGAIFNSKFKNAIYMKDAYRDIYSVLVLYAYYDDVQNGIITRKELVQNITKERIDSVGSLLQMMKENIAGWEVDFGKEEMAKGANCINLSWSGDAQWAIQEAAEVGIKLNYEVPTEGTNVWFDGWCIPIYAKNIKAATYFIDYMCKPANAIKNMEEIGYVSVIGNDEILYWAEDIKFPEVDASYIFGKNAKKMHLNPVMYPDKCIIDRAVLMNDADDKTLNDLISMWNSAKGDNLSKTWKIIITIIALTAVIAITSQLVKQLKNKKLNKSKKKKH